MILSSIYIIIIAIAFGSSIYSFKLSYPAHLKLLCLLLGATLIAEWWAVYGVQLLGVRNNMIIYNPFMLIEFIVYGLYFKMLTHLQWLKTLINWYVFALPVLWLICTFILFGIYNWDSYVTIIGSLFTIFFAVIYYYELLTSSETMHLTTTPEFWIATGLIIFYGGNLPYVGMLNYLIKNYMSLATNLTYVLKILNIVMYSLFAYAYLCRRSVA